jgi:hypothetical protein
VQIDMLEHGDIEPFSCARRGSGRFHVNLLGSSLRDKIEATFKKGVLTVALPKSAEARPAGTIRIFKFGRSVKVGNSWIARHP